MMDRRRETQRKRQDEAIRRQALATMLETTGWAYIRDHCCAMAVGRDREIANPRQTEAERLMRIGEKKAFIDLLTWVYREAKVENPLEAHYMGLFVVPQLPRSDMPEGESDSRKEEALQDLLSTASRRRKGASSMVMD